MILAITLGLIGALFLALAQTRPPFRRERTATGWLNYRIRDGVPDHDVYNHMFFKCICCACFAAAAMRFFDFYG
jgi:hypothetical protein